MSNAADSLSHEAQLKRLWRWVGELSIEINGLKKEIHSLKARNHYDDGQD
jgi:hypothetical protein